MRNTERFTGHVADFSHYRERYDPAVVLPFLQQACGLQPAWTVADIGAGTGMLAEVFLSNGNPVLAIEPNDKMREACLALHAGSPTLTILNGTAESTTLPTASVDIVSIGRALHWFDLDAAIPEFRRILKPGGWVVVLALGRARDGRPANTAFEALLRAFSPSPQASHPSYDAIGRLPQIFAGGTMLQKDAKTELHLDWAALRGLSLSSSNAPLPGNPAHPAFNRAVRHFFDQYQVNGHITFDIRHWISAARFAPAVNPPHPAGNTSAPSGV